jgi:hypothetical protein
VAGSSDWPGSALIVRPKRYQQDLFKNTKQKLAIFFAIITPKIQTNSGKLYYFIY